MKIPGSIFLFVFSSVLSAEPLKVEVSAGSAIVMNAETGAILFEKNPNELRYPASVTKIATALYALEKKTNLEEEIIAPLDAVVAVSPAVRRAPGSKHPSHRLEFGGTHMGIKAGEILSFRSLLYGLMLTSGNDAANAIAQNISQSVPKFMEELNQYLKEIGCQNTHFSNPHGLPSPDHQTTAYDLAKMAQMGLKNPIFREIVKTVRYTRPETNKQKEAYLLQTNQLMRKSPFYYPKAIGIKTGYTKSGGYTLVAAAQDAERTLICVLLNCPDLRERYKDAIRLFDTAFQEKKVTRKILDKKEDLFSCHIKGAKNNLQACLKEDLNISYFPSEESKYKVLIQWHQNRLPIKQDQEVGEIKLLGLDGSFHKKEPIFAVNDVETTFLYPASTFCKRVFNNKITYLLLGIIVLISVAAAILCRKKVPETDS